MEELENFVANMTMYFTAFDLERENINLVRFLENHQNVADTLQECLLHFMEMQRNEMVTSFIDTEASEDEDDEK